jgi:uncharacterized protein YkwD
MRRFALLGALCLSLGLLLASNASAFTLPGPIVGTPDAAHGGDAHASLRARAISGNRGALRLLAAPTTDCVGADDPRASNAVQETAMFCLLNYARQQAGLPKLNDYRKLGGSAANKAADILRCNEFSHEACGRDFLYWFRRAGYLTSRCWWAGENLAWGTGSLGSARSIMKAWLHSPSHRANMLSSDYAETGISLRNGSLSGSSDAHVWVNHFGRHC